MPYTWEFMEEKDGERRSWYWKKHALDGSSHDAGIKFYDYGEVTKDAVANGFRPSRQPWVVITAHTITHFSKDHLPLTETRHDQDLRPEPPTR